MAKATFILSVVLLLLFIVSEIEAGAAPKLCEKASKTYSGKCDNKKCDKKCIDWEKAAHGACHKREGKDACFCYFDCSKSPAPPGATPAPPGAVPPPGTPPADGGAPPSEGGGSPPPAEGGGEGGGSPPPSSH